MRDHKRTKPGRIGLTFLCCVMAVPTASLLLPGQIIVADMTQAVAMGVLLGIAYLVARPILRLMTLPLGCLTFGLFHGALDVALIYAGAYLIEGFEVASLLAAVLLAFFLNTLIAAVGGFR